MNSSASSGGSISGSGGVSPSSVRCRVVAGLRVRGLVGEHGDAQHEHVGDFDAGEAPVLRHAGQRGGEDVVRAPAVVLAGFVDCCHERGPGGRFLEVVSLRGANKHGPVR